MADDTEGGTLDANATDVREVHPYSTSGIDAAYARCPPDT